MNTDLMIWVSTTVVAAVSAIVGSREIVRKSSRVAVQSDAVESVDIGSRTVYTSSSALLSVALELADMRKEMDDIKNEHREQISRLRDEHRQREREWHLERRQMISWARMVMDSLESGNLKGILRPEWLKDPQ